MSTKEATKKGKAAQESQHSASPTVASLQVTGMSCASCVAHVQEAVAALPGVKNVVVNLATSSARVDYSPQVTPLAEVIKTVQALGYGASEKLDERTALDREKEAREKEVKR